MTPNLQRKIAALQRNRNLRRFGLGSYPEILKAYWDLAVWPNVAYTVRQTGDGRYEHTFTAKEAA